MVSSYWRVVNNLKRDESKRTVSAKFYDFIRSHPDLSNPSEIEYIRELAGIAPNPSSDEA
ncbi:MAG: hypothetical protein K2W94_05670 [Alphaproteobacteria bacterium]|nr:hypothetical protein [Alphaproteobacteria bacterium]